MKYNTALPYFHENDIDFILAEFGKILRGEGLLSMGHNVKEFEVEFAKYIGVAKAIATSSCTAALENILMAAGIKSGDEVIVPAQTFIATASSVIRAGAKPVFAEINSNFLLDYEDVIRRVNKKTKAVILVHFAGLIDTKVVELKDYLNSRSILLIEDAAHAHGASIHGRKAGSIGDAAAFSFFSTKIMTTGEGGMIATDNLELADRCASIRSRGLDLNANHEIFNSLGTNQRMTEVQALMGRTQLKRLDEFVDHRNHLAAVYRQNLRPAIEGGLIEIPDVPEFLRHSYWRYIVLLRNGQNRDEIAKNMAEQSVKIDWAYQPLVHLQPVIKKLFCIDENMLPFSEKLASTHICLPIHMGISKEDVVYISKMLLKCLYRDKNI
jgi:perosamine synthetase